MYTKEKFPKRPSSYKNIFFVLTQLIQFSNLCPKTALKTNLFSRLVWNLRHIKLLNINLTFHKDTLIIYPDSDSYLLGYFFLETT